MVAGSDSSDVQPLPQLSPGGPDNSGISQQFHVYHTSLLSMGSKVDHASVTLACPATSSIVGMKLNG